MNPPLPLVAASIWRRPCAAVEHRRPFAHRRHLGANDVTIDSAEAGEGAEAAAGNHALSANTVDEALQALRLQPRVRIQQAGRAAAKVTGIWCSIAEMAHALQAQGLEFVVPGHDVIWLKAKIARRLAVLGASDAGKMREAGPS